MRKLTFILLITTFLLCSCGLPLSATARPTFGFVGGYPAAADANCQLELTKFEGKDVKLQITPTMNIDDVHNLFRALGDEARATFRLSKASTCMSLVFWAQGATIASNNGIDVAEMHKITLRRGNAFTLSSRIGRNAQIIIEEGDSFRSIAAIRWEVVAHLR